MNHDEADQARRWVWKNLVEWAYENPGRTPDQELLMLKEAVREYQRINRAEERPE